MSKDLVVKTNRLDNRSIQVVSGRWMQTIFNVYEEKPWDEYGINDQFYLDRIYKEIKSLMPEKFNNQTSLSFN